MPVAKNNIIWNGTLINLMTGKEDKEKVKSNSMPRQIRMDVSSTAFYIYWIILLVGKGMGFTSSDLVFQYMATVAVTFVAMKLLTSKWSKNELITCIMMNLIGIVQYLFSKDVSVLLTMLTITACKDIDIYKLLKLSFWIKGIMFVLVTSLAIHGVIDKQLIRRYYSSDIYETRFGLGYGHPNTTQYTLFVILVLAVLVYHHKMKFYHYALFLLFCVYIYQYTLSRTGLIMSVLVAFLSYAIDRKGGFVLRRVFKYVGEYSYVIGAIVSFIICYLFSKSAVLQSLGTLSSRFMTGTSTIRTNSLTLFGNPNIDTDFGYIKILYENGVVVLFLFLLSMTLLIKKCIRNNMYIETMVLILYAVYTCAEAYTASVLMNVGLLLVVWIIYPKNARNTEMCIDNEKKVA